MANVLVEKQSLIDTADAIRAKLGTQALIAPEDFDDRISEISGGGVDYGTIVAYNPSMDDNTEVINASNCTATVTDGQAFYEFCIKHNWFDWEQMYFSGDELGTALYYDSNYSAWGCEGDYETRVSTDELASNGLSITMNSGASSAQVQVQFEYEINADTPTTTQSITSELDYYTLGYVSTSINGHMMGYGNPIVKIGGGGIIKRFVRSYTFGADCHTAPMYFLADTPNLVSISGLDQTDIAEIPGYFLFLSSINSAFTLPTTLKKIGPNFMGSCAQFNQNVNFRNVEDIGEGAFSECSSFNSTVTIPNIKHIGSSFLSNCPAYNKDITLPASLEKIETAFLGYCRDMVSTVYIETNTDSLPLGWQTFSPGGNSSAPAYVTGIGLGGTYAQKWKNGIANSDQNPYRKLRLVS